MTSINPPAYGIHYILSNSNRLRLTMFPLNGLPVRIRIQGYDFDFKLLNGHNHLTRLYQARYVPETTTEFGWHWTVGSMPSLRNQISYKLGLLHQKRDHELWPELF